MNEKNMLKVRQICFLYLALTPVTKLSIYPCFLSRYAEESLWISALFGFLFDLLIIGAALYISKKHPDKTVYAITEERLGKPFAKIIFFIYALFFFAKATLPLIEQKTYIENTLYEIMPSPFIFYPFFIVSVFACLNGMKIFGRVADIAVFVTITGIVIALGLIIPAGDYSNFLPIFKKPAYNLVNGAFRSIMWHSDGVYMLMFLGHFKREKNYSGKIILSYAAAAMISLVFVAGYYAIYGSIAKSQTFALTTATVFSVSAANVGRFDFLSIFLLLFSQIFATVFPLFASTKCLERVFGFKSAKIPAAIVNVLTFSYTLIFGKKLLGILDFNANVLSYFILAVSVAITLVFVMIPRSKNEILKG